MEGIRYLYNNLAVKILIWNLRQQTIFVLPHMQLLAHCVIDFVDTDSGYRLSTKEMSVLCGQARTRTNGLYLKVLLK